MTPEGRERGEGGSGGERGRGTGEVQRCRNSADIHTDIVNCVQLTVIDANVAIV